MGLSPASIKKLRSGFNIPNTIGQQTALGGLCMVISGLKTVLPKPGLKTLFRCAGFSLFGVVLTLIPVVSHALTGRIEVRGSQQDGGAGQTSYNTSTLW